MAESMNDRDNSTPIIKITVSQMFDQIKLSLQEIDRKLELKADSKVMDKIYTDVELLKSAEIKRSAVEAALLAKGTASMNERHWQIPTLISFFGVVLVAMEVLVGTRIVH